MRTVGTVSTSFLIHLDEAARALKNKDFQIIGNRIIGLNNNDLSVSYTVISSDYYNPVLQGVIIATRDLSKFVKSIMLESEFEIKTTFTNGKWRLHSSTETLDIFYPITPYYTTQGIERLYTSDSVRMRPILSERTLINPNIKSFFDLKKDDGFIKYNHDNKFLITIFQGLLNVTKSDNIYLTIHQYDNVSFIAHFEVIKKKFTIHVFSRYLYL